MTLLSLLLQARWEGTVGTSPRFLPVTYGDMTYVYLLNLRVPNFWKEDKERVGERKRSKQAEVMIYL